MSTADASAVETRIKSAFDGMESTGPEGLLEIVNFLLRKQSVELDEHELVGLLTSADPNALARKAAHMALARWDHTTQDDWAEGTESNTVERRERVYDLLELTRESRQLLDATFPTVAQRDILIAQPGPWDPWYVGERRVARDFYWRAYRGVLERKGWSPDTIGSLDAATADIIGRLADPAGTTTYQSKGLVVGYVQSGKTANFTGIVAKAIDAGYRLIIVLTGTVELLRAQTQRRLDMELIGEENILGGRDRDNPDAIRDVDYVGNDHDSDWYAGNFLKHGVDLLGDPDIPSIKRLTSARKDYRRLEAGLDVLDFRRTGELKAPGKPVWDPENIFGTDVRIAVIKKNKAALQALIRDIQDVRADAREIPTLIIDDEADQASINTTNPLKVKNDPEAKQRTMINGLIAETLGLLPRAQYLGYTATPFANVFVSPDDAVDIFPKDFILSLEPSSDYMGGKEFHDLVPVDPASATPATSNEMAFVRPLIADDDVDEESLEMQSAIDAFVLSGAIKRWRSDRDPNLHFRHHTMLVHQSVRTAEHKDLAELVEEVWSIGGYSSPIGLGRLRELYETDFVPVHDSRQWGTELPADFADLKQYIGETVDEITKDGSPVVIVNGSKDSDYDAMDFQRRPYWRIMVGGAKLSRGFTVEGLTVSYYRRRATAADTLMQMGRWFGYRPGYKDLVRLYIARDVVSGGKSYDLYDMFTSILEDEEDFREQLRRFSKLDEDGRPLVLPKNVPPMVFSQLSWLKPTGTNRMYNAVLKLMATGGRVKDLFRLPPRSEGKHAANFAASRSLLDGSQAVTISDIKGELPDLPARVAIRTPEEVIRVLRSMRWMNDSIETEIGFMLEAMDKGTLTDWLIVLPVLGDAPQRDIDGLTIPLIQRKRRSRGDFSGSEPKHRPILEFAAQLPGAKDFEPEERLLDEDGTRGAILLNFAYEAADGRYLMKDLPDELSADDVVTQISLAYPYKSAPRGRIAFQVRREDDPDAVIVDI